MELFVNIYSKLLVLAFFSVPVALVRGLIIIFRALSFKRKDFTPIRVKVLDRNTVTYQEDGEDVLLFYPTSDDMFGKEIDLYINGTTLVKPPRSIKQGLVYILSAAMFVALLVLLPMIVIGNH